MTALRQDVPWHSQNVAKHGPVRRNFTAGFNLSKNVDKHVGMSRAIDDGPAFNNEFRNGVNEIARITEKS